MLSQQVPGRLRQLLRDVAARSDVVGLYRDVPSAPCHAEALATLLDLPGTVQLADHLAWDLSRGSGDAVDAEVTGAVDPTWAFGMLADGLDKRRRATRAFVEMSYGPERLPRAGIPDADRVVTWRAELGDRPKLGALRQLSAQLSAPFAELLRHVSSRIQGEVSVARQLAVDEIRAAVPAAQRMLGLDEVLTRAGAGHVRRLWDRLAATLDDALAAEVLATMRRHDGQLDPAAALAMFDAEGVFGRALHDHRELLLAQLEAEWQCVRAVIDGATAACLSPLARATLELSTLPLEESGAEG